MKRHLPAPAEVEHVLREQVSAAISCYQRDDRLILDTPYTLQDGSVLRAYITAGEDALRVSDGGATMLGLMQYARSDAVLDHLSRKVGAIARKLRLVWQDGEIFYDASDVQEAMRRLPILAQAVDAALCLIT